MEIESMLTANELKEKTESELAEAMFFGSESRLVRALKSGDFKNRVELLRELIEKENEVPERPSLQIAELQLALFELLRSWQAESSAPYKAQLKTQLEMVIQSANRWLGETAQVSVRTSDKEGSSEIRTHRGSLFDTLDSLRETYGNTAGFWLVLDFFEQQLPGKYLPPRSSQTNSLQRQALTAALFHDQAKAKGHLLWLQVELFNDYTGFFIPDIISHGLTDISGLIEPMDEVWRASGLAERFRGVWRFLDHYPGDHPEFMKVQKPKYLPSLSGRSIQAAALAALWAASGRIPLPVEADASSDSPKFFTLDVKTERSFTLTPFVVISAVICPEGTTIELASSETVLSAIEKDSVRFKVDAAARYSVDGDPKNSLFDKVIVSEADKKEANEVVSELKRKAGADKYHGVEVMSDCKTIGDALNWLLEVNIWKHSWHQHCQADWESQWGFARNEDIEYLDIEGNVTEDPSKYINTGTLDYMRSPLAQSAGAKEIGDEDRKLEKADADQEVLG